MRTAGSCRHSSVVEHRLGKTGAVGSIPTGGSKREARSHGGFSSGALSLSPEGRLHNLPFSGRDSKLSSAQERLRTAKAAVRMTMRVGLALGEVESRSTLAFADIAQW